MFLRVELSDVVRACISSVSVLTNGLGAAPRLPDGRTVAGVDVGDEASSLSRGKKVAYLLSADG